MRVALILGAGWSAAAGYPLAADLLRGAVHVGTEASRVRVQAVLEASRGWASADAFLAAVRDGAVLLPPDPEDPSLFDDAGGRPLPWGWAVEAVTLELLWPGAGPGRAELLAARTDFRRREGGHLDAPVRAEAHEEFVAQLEAEHELIGVVTTNYDTLAEGVLRGRFHYGGLGPGQRGMGANAWDYYNEPDPEKNALELTGAIPLCKLHGSINWELAGTGIAIWRDMRLPHRDAGGAAIVAPGSVPEPWLRPVWEAAATTLAAAERWIVVGASTPHAVLRESAARSVELHDPAAEALIPVWEQFTGAPVSAHPGLATPAQATRASHKLSFFYGIHISMLRPPADGEVPQFRAQYLTSRAAFAIATLELLEGSLPDRALALVREWAAARREALDRNWALAQRNAAEEPIAPLA